LRVLSTTWPALPDPALVLFVPALVTVAAAVGIEILRSSAGAGPAVLPSLVDVGISQLYQPVSSITAALAALGWAAGVPATLAATRDAAIRDGHSTATGTRTRLAVVLPAAVTVVALVLGAFVVAGVAPQGRSAYLLAAHEQQPNPPDDLSNPLD